MTENNNLNSLPLISPMDIEEYDLPFELDGLYGLTQQITHSEPSIHSPPHNLPSPIFSPMDIEDYDFPFDLNDLSGLTQQIEPEVFDLIDDLPCDNLPTSSFSPFQPSQTILTPPTPFKDSIDASVSPPILNHDPRKRYLLSTSHNDPLAPPAKKPRHNHNPHKIQPHCSSNPPPNPVTQNQTSERHNIQPHCSSNPPPNPVTQNQTSERHNIQPHCSSNPPPNPVTQNQTSERHNIQPHCSSNPPPNPVTQNQTSERHNIQPHCSSNPPPNPVTQNQTSEKHTPTPPTQSGCGGVDKPPFEVISDDRRNYRKFKADTRWTTLRFRDPRIGEDFSAYLFQMFEALLVYLPQQHVAPHDRVGLTITNSGRPEQRAIGISLRRMDQLDADVILKTIQTVLQSNDEFFINGKLEVRFLHIKMENGGHRGRVDIVSTYEDFCRSKKGIYVVTNDDNLCLARALVVGVAYSRKLESNDRKKIFNKIRRKNRNLQRSEAQRLCDDSGVDLTNGGGVEELRMFQQHLASYTITVFSGRRGKEVMFEGPESTPEHPRKHIDLIFGNNHFNVIMSLTAAFNTRRYCRPCRFPYEHVEEHRCPQKCTACNHSPICEDRGRGYIECATCGRLFKNQSCFDKHKRPLYRNNKSVCDVAKYCVSCKKVYSTLTRKDAHVCGEAYCPTCNAYRPSGHLCFMTKDMRKTADPNAKYMYVFFDFECSQDMPSNLNEGCYVHNPNFCVTQQACYNCVKDVNVDNACEVCGTRQHVFSGDNTLKDFMAYMTKPRKEFTNVVMIAHNMKAYDGQFILNYMTQTFKWTPEVIMNGTKIQMIKHSNIKIIDSLNFFSCKLSELPAMFDLSCENKGYFPHFFNRLENWEYEGELPTTKDYGSETMKKEERVEFMKWYNLRKTRDDNFNFQSEIKQYCIQDVNILRLACLSFRDIFLKENQIDPFLNSITIASACMLTFRKHFLRPNTIGVIPAGGYRMGDRQSAVALQWLRWVEHSQQLDIQHAGNGREARVSGYKVDGFHLGDRVDESVVYEFHGCWWHGCTLCYKDRSAPYPNSPHETMATRYERTMRKKRDILSEGYKVIEIWECTFNQQKTLNRTMRDFLEGEDQLCHTPLNPRDAFYGGRTNCTKLLYEAKDGEKIRYYDVRSLYPFICKYSKMPTGHATVLVGKDCPQDIQGLDGFIKATVLPPQNLYHPVLPSRIKNKLLFPLCRTCAEGQNNLDCTHSNAERVLTGTWVSDELQKAVEMGYEVIKVHEVWKYSTSQYNGRDGGLFNGYINKFLKLKQEASGWPSWCVSDEEKDRYIRDFKLHEGITLDKAKIKKNKGFRALAKMMLNSFWGKFGQRDNLSQTNFLSTREELTNLLANPGVVTDDILPLSDDVMLANWHYDGVAVSPSSRANVAVAAYVTAFARLKLYTYLQMLGDRVLYFDTDSIVFVDRTGMPCPSLGDYLGDLTDELEEYGRESYIDTFVSGGPKNYAFRVVVGGSSQRSFVCKVKGINLHYSNGKRVNFKIMKAMVSTSVPQEVVLYGKKIFRTKDMEVLTKMEKKTYRVVYTKRRRVEDYDTIPFGFKRTRHSIPLPSA